ncbi:MAG: cytidylate kinase-like family protein [Paludibacter sp.]|jgi:cytidylate kinase|nr:cytidylate kinase-like family protein [Paludibacter sp.]
MNKIITIGRQYAAGGRLIGELLANRLGFQFFDKELISMAAKESGLCSELYEKADEKKRFTFFHGVLHGHPTTAGIMDNYINNETLFKIQSDIIRSLAETNDCIFVGRGSDYVLRDNPNILNIFITADINDRIERLSERQNLPNNRDMMLDILEKTDKKRANFYNYFTNKQWGTASSYHLTINSSLLGIERTVDTIVAIANDCLK